MTGCADIQLRLSDFIDDGLDPSERAAVATHLETCAACAALVRDLHAVRRAARSLGAIDPPSRIYSKVAARVAVEPAPRRWLRIAAAVALVAAGAYAVVRFDQRAIRFAPRPGNAAAPSAVEAAGDDWRTVVTHYEEAIAALEPATTRDDHQVDPALAATLHSTLAEVDDAIDQSRAALAADPDSQPARDGLAESLRRKVSVLQATIAVISDTPEGD